MSQYADTLGTELLDTIKQHAGLVLGLGILLLVLGILALVAPLAAGLSIALATGVLLLVGGIGQLFFSFKAGSFGRGLMIFILGVLTVLAGIIMIAQPGVGLATLTLFLAAYFIVEGVFEIIWSFQLKPATGWGWALFSGIVSLLLGIMIWSQFPLSGAWAIGVLVGVKLIFSGMTLVFLGSGVRSLAKDVRASL